MFSAFRMDPAASGRGLCDTDRVLIILYYSKLLNRFRHARTSEIL